VAGAVSAQTGAPKYDFSVLAELNHPAPGGGTFINDFEPSAFNDSGMVAFTADLSTGGEGVFIEQGGTVSQVVRAGMPGPGGLTFGPGELGTLGLNAAGDVAVPFSLSPSTATNIPAGVWRFDRSSGVLSPAAVPGTPTPGGGTLKGIWFNLGMNNRGDILFPALATGTQIHPAPPGDDGIAVALFRLAKDGTISSVVRPGDPAPGGRVFDDAWNASINNSGDIGFSGHVEGDVCIDIGSPYACGDSVYLRDGASSVIRSIAHQGDPAPGGGTFNKAFGGLINDAGKIALIGDLTPMPATGQVLGVFSYDHGALSAVARPGDPMPGGNAFETASTFTATSGINGPGDIAFAATLDTNTTGDAFNDTGMYVASHGSLQLVARSGTVIPGLGTIEQIGQPQNIGVPLYGTGGMINNRGQVLFNATLTDGTGVLLVATPAP
jgi:hypothetical protein